MIDSKERNRRDEAHLRADMAWSAIERKGYGLPRSRTAGLGDMARRTARKADPIEVRAHRQKMHKARLQAEAARARRDAPVFDARTLDRSRYFPHQGEREIARRKRQAEAIAAKHAA